MASRTRFNTKRKVSLHFLVSCPEHWSPRPIEDQCWTESSELTSSRFLLSSVMQEIRSNTGNKPRPLASVWRALVEIAFIVFLFYSNLLMGEFTVANGRGKTLTAALTDILTATNFLIAIASALIGHLVFEFLRKRL
jgi:hypothetical protein